MGRTDGVVIQARPDFSRWIRTGHETLTIQPKIMVAMNGLVNEHSNLAKMQVRCASNLLPAGILD